MPEGDPRVGEAPTEPDGLTIPVAGEVDEAHLEVAQLDPHLAEVQQERPHPLPDVGGLGLLPACRGSAVGAAVGVAKCRETRKLSPVFLGFYGLTIHRVLFDLKTIISTKSA